MYWDALTSIIQRSIMNVTDFRQMHRLYWKILHMCQLNHKQNKPLCCCSCWDFFFHSSWNNHRFNLSVIKLLQKSAVWSGSTLLGLSYLSQSPIIPTIQCSSSSLKFRLLHYHLKVIIKPDFFFRNPSPPPPTSALTFQSFTPIHPVIILKPFYDIPPLPPGHKNSTECSV